MDKKNIIPCIGLAFMLAFFLPIDTYYSNITHFEFNIKEIWIFLFLLFIIISLVTIIISYIDKKNIFIHIIEALFIGNYLSYFLFIPFYCKINNKVLNPLIESFPIYIVFFLFAIFAIKNYKITNYICLILLLMQIITTGTILYQNKNINNEHKTIYIADGSEQFELGTENVIIIVLDRVPNTFFEDAAKDNSKIYETFKDFTYYNNCNGGYEGTYLGMNHLLTTKDYNPSDDINTWLNKIWCNNDTENIYNEIHNLGYKSNFYISTTSKEFSYELMYEKFDNIKKIKQKDLKTNKIVAFKLLMYSSMCKIYNNDITKYFTPKTDDVYNVGNKIMDLNNDYYNSLKKNKLKINNNKYFVVQHLYGLHGGDGYITTMPCTNEYCEYAPNSTSEQALEGCRLILEEYFKQLKSLNVYDNSTIIVTSDHGEYLTYENSQPIFLIKEKKQQNNKMKINNAPISHEDVLPTVLKLMNSKKDFGNTIYDFNENTPRTRKYHTRGQDFSQPKSKKYLSNYKSNTNILRTYEYTGDRNTLKEIGDKNEYTETKIEESLY